MGEYFCWINVAKREYLTPHDFVLGNKVRESSFKKNPLLLALWELLATQWYGDQIVFIGDEGMISSETPFSVLYKLNAQAKSESYFDYICANYRNVSCLFRAAEVEVREEILDYLEGLKNSHHYTSINEYGIDIEHPFLGLFMSHGRRFRFIINHTKKVYYSPIQIKVRFSNGAVSNYTDPLPLLMVYGRSVKPGVWLGDVIGVSNKIPIGYRLLREISYEG